jgi:biopolymer transport protein TolR
MAAQIERAASGKRRKGVAPDINITPLVDVVLVLLIIFMVVTPQLEAGEAVELPVIGNPDPKVKSKLDPITLTYTLSGKYFLEKDQLDEPSLRERLVNEHQTHPDRRLVLKGDRSIPYGRMRELFATCKDVGFPGVSLVVGEKTARGKKTEE